MVDLMAYNISISSESQHPEKFYGICLPSVTSLSSDDPDNTQEGSDSLIRVMSHLNFATSPQETRTNQRGLDFTEKLLDVLGYSIGMALVAPLPLSWPRHYRSVVIQINQQGQVFSLFRGSHPSCGPNHHQWTQAP